MMLDGTFGQRNIDRTSGKPSVKSIQHKVSHPLTDGMMARLRKTRPRLAVVAFID